LGRGIVPICDSDGVCAIIIADIIGRYGKIGIIIGGRVELIPGIGDFHGGNADADGVLIGMLKGVLEVGGGVQGIRISEPTIHIHNLLS
jgi:hypothetical protein